MLMFDTEYSLVIPKWRGNRRSLASKVECKGEVDIWQLWRMVFKWNELDVRERERVVAGGEERVCEGYREWDNLALVRPRKELYVAVIVCSVQCTLRYLPTYLLSKWEWLWGSTRVERGSTCDKVFHGQNVMLYSGDVQIGVVCKIFCCCRCEFLLHRWDCMQRCTVLLG